MRWPDEIFSKIDLVLAYHQLDLAGEYCYNTIFSTHLGLRHMRLFFGVTSAAKIYQNQIAGVLARIDDVVNASDEILAHGETVAQHNI